MDFGGIRGIIDYHDPDSSELKYARDALGRLTEVQAMDPYGSGSLGLVTNYAYDALSDLTSVDQIGVSPEQPRLRSFSYDGLSRLVSATNPESGTTTYRYTASGGSLCSGDSSSVCSRTDARGITTTYTYDALNRLTGKSYSNEPANAPTPALTIAYDTSTQPLEYDYYYIGHVTEIDSTLGTTPIASWIPSGYDQAGRLVGHANCLWQTNATCVQ